MKESNIIKILIFSSLVLALLGGFIFLKQGGWFEKNDLAGLINLTNPEKKQSNSLIKLIWQIGGFSGEKNYLLLFQNNLELRPSGGYIGNFGILKVKNGKIISLETHDTTIYDGFGKIQTEPPEPMKKYLKINNWQMRDSNWSPDFAAAAQQAEYFYHFQSGQTQDGQEKFDGIIGINAAVLPNLLELTGPIYLAKFDKTFVKDDVLYQLEYEIEKGYVQRGIDPGQRKAIFKELIKTILNKLSQKNLWQINELKDLALKELDQKNILLYFHDQSLKNEIIKLGWTGQVDQEYAYDYLMLNEANLGGKKSNYFIKRSIEYFVDLSQDRPQVKLKIAYHHQGQTNDWFNHDYLAYLRVYVPQGSWLLATTGLNSQPNFSKDLGKTVFGHWLIVPTGQEKVVELTYLLPEDFKQESFYKILIQKQPGIDQLPIKIKVKTSDKNFLKEKVISQDWQGAIFFEQ